MALAHARRLFERLLARCNDVGLLAEELEPCSGRMLGNFPQAYSHVGLINSALNLTRRVGPADERSGQPGRGRSRTKSPPRSARPGPGKQSARGVTSPSDGAL